MKRKFLFIPLLLIPLLALIVIPAGFMQVVPEFAEGGSSVTMTVPADEGLVPGAAIQWLQSIPDYMLIAVIGMLLAGSLIVVWPKLSGVVMRVIHPLKYPQYS